MCDVQFNSKVLWNKWCLLIHPRFLILVAIIRSRGWMLRWRYGIGREKREHFNSEWTYFKCSRAILSCSFGRNIKITGILYLHKINDNRMTQPLLPHYQMFRGLLGEGFHSRVLLVTTMWEKLSNRNDGERRKVILRRHWSEMIYKGSEIVRHDGNKESAWSVVKALLALQPN